jgi:hypothetical protein
MRMRILTAAIVALALIAAPMTAAMAREFTDTEKQGLAETIKGFDEAMGGGDFERIVATIPPKVLQSMADKFKLPIDQLRTSVIEQSKEALKTVTIVSYAMDLDHAEYKETADGTPYVLVPTETVMEVGKDKLRATAQTLAIFDEGQWYLVRVSEKAQVDIFKAVYPSFTDVEFPEGKLEPVS